MQRRDLLKLSLALVGSAASASVSRAVQAGVNEQSTPAKSVLSPSQQGSVKLLSDMIIPPTDTPGAVDAGVPAFIDTIVTEWYRDEERRIFLQGLDDLDAFCIEWEQKAFDAAAMETRVAALQSQEKAAASYRAPPGGLFGSGSPDENAPFFNKLRELVVLGYYTSAVGSREELIYLPMPGHYDGNYDFSKVGRQWTTE